jgi:hypothetical protein
MFTISNINIMTNHDLPNLFRYATSELSQDAVTAYLLSWADPTLRQLDADAHAAGDAFLQSLLNHCTPPIADLAIQSVTAGRQWEHIDVWCIINRDILLIIEDKTGSAEHGEQIAEYLKKAGTFEWQGQPFREIRAIYMKTGDETLKSLSKANCGVFLRKDLLSVLGPYANTSNTIVREFARYLAEIEARSSAYLVTPPQEWSWQMVQGFYAELEQRMAIDLGVRDAKWEQVNPPSGAFLALHWCWHQFPSKECMLYLQLMHGSKLMLRLANWDDAVSPDQMRSALQLAQDLAASDERFTNIELAKAGRFRGGYTAGLITLFSEAPSGFCAVGEQGAIDLEGTMERIRIASAFAQALSER